MSSSTMRSIVNAEAIRCAPPALPSDFGPPIKYLIVNQGMKVRSAVRFLWSINPSTESAGYARYMGIMGREINALQGPTMGNAPSR